MTPSTTTSAWSPFRLPVFRALWIATLVSNVGTWMHDIGAGWLMMSLSPSPVMVALVQTATTLPVFLLALPAGALADIIDRRRHLIVTQVFMAITAGCLATITLTGAATPWLLVTLTFAMGLGTAMTLPAWAAIVPELVPRRELPAALEPAPRECPMIVAAKYPFHSFRCQPGCVVVKCSVRNSIRARTLGAICCREG